MPKLSERGVVHLLMPVILLIGLIAGVYLVTSGNPLKLFSSAANPPIVFKDLSGRVLPVVNGVSQTNSSSVIVELTSTLGAPASVSGPISGPNRTGTVSYRTALNPTDLDHAVSTPYLKEPTVYNSTLPNNTGTQFYWVEFKNTQGKVDRRSAQIQIVSPKLVTLLNFSLSLPGIDGNRKPNHAGRTMMIQVFNASDSKMVVQKTVDLPYKGSGKFNGSTELQALPAGEYNIFSKIDGYLSTVNWGVDLISRLDSPVLLLQPLAGDMDPKQNDVIDTADVAFYTNCQNKDISQVPSCLPADFNDDGVVNNYDYAIWSQNYGKKGPTVNQESAPTPTPAVTSKRVFVTSTTYNGNLGGLAGADLKCRTRASAANLGGIWKAWLSDSKTSASSRLNHNNGPYKLLNGTTIANNWTDLTDGILKTSIDKNEFNTQKTGFVWTNTRIDGSTSVSIYTNTCNDFTSNGYATVLHSGFAGYSDQSWTDRSIQTACNIPMNLYCFEQ